MKLGPYELNTIVTGDARELAQAIPNNSIDIIFTSPPYNVGLSYSGYDDNLSDEEYWSFITGWLIDMYRIAKDPSRFYLIVGDDLIWRIKGIAEDIGWSFHQPLVWCKPNISGGPGRISKDWNMMAEWCLLFHKGKRTPMLPSQTGEATTFNWIIEPSCQSNFNGHLRKVHPAQFPLRVAVSWLSRTPGEIVLDPFVGSGTVAQAAKLLGRNYLAFEIDPLTAALARERVLLTQPPLFVVQPEQAAMELICT